MHVLSSDLIELWPFLSGKQVSTRCIVWNLLKRTKRKIVLLRWFSRFVNIKRKWILKEVVSIYVFLKHKLFIFSYFIYYLIYSTNVKYVQLVKNLLWTFKDPNL